MKETKAKLFGLLTNNPDIDLKQLVQELSTPIATLKRWRKEFIDNNRTNTLTKVEEVVVDKIVKEFNAPVEIKHKINSLQMLQEETQATAYTIINMITEKLKLEVDGNEIFLDIDTKELVALTGALTSVQNAFFNRPQTNVQVNNIGESTGLSDFRKRLRS